MECNEVEMYGKNDPQALTDSGQGKFGLANPKFCKPCPETISMEKCENTACIYR
jgi:hypothetical protein